MNEIERNTGYAFSGTGTFAGGNSPDAIVAHGGGILQKLELNADVWASKDSFREHMKAIPEGYFYSKSPKAFIVHEAGHGLAFKNHKDVPRLQEIYSGWRIPTGGKPLSEFSMSNYREMTAEAFTAHFFGDRAALNSSGLGELAPIFDRWTGQHR